MTTLDKPKLSYNVAEAAEAVGISEDQMRKIIRAGHIAKTTPPGFSRPLIRAEELQSWLDSGEQ